MVEIAPIVHAAAQRSRVRCGATGSLWPPLFPGLKQDTYEVIKDGETVPLSGPELFRRDRAACVRFPVRPPSVARSAASFTMAAGTVSAP